MREDFRRPLWLKGWEGQSIWGFDEGVGSYFAQLWRDEDFGDNPTVWISGVEPRFTMVEQLFTVVVAATRAPFLSVYQAMQFPELNPATKASPPQPAEIRDRQLEAASDGQTDAYPRGAADALAWALWDLPIGPVTGQFVSVTPTAEQIEAERWAATAAVYQRDDQPQGYFAGAETALMWVRGQADSPY